MTSSKTPHAGASPALPASAARADTAGADATPCEGGNQWDGRSGGKSFPAGKASRFPISENPFPPRRERSFYPPLASVERIQKSVSVQVRSPFTIRNGNWSKLCKAWHLRFCECPVRTRSGQSRLIRRTEPANRRSVQAAAMGTRCRLDGGASRLNRGVERRAAGSQLGPSFHRYGA
jgi:hypothetical protein